MKNSITRPQAVLPSNPHSQSHLQMPSNIINTSYAIVEKRKRGRPRKVQPPEPNFEYKASTPELQNQHNRMHNNKAGKKPENVLEKNDQARKNEFLSKKERFDSGCAVSENVDPVTTPVTRPLRYRGAYQSLKSAKQLEPNATNHKQDEGSAISNSKNVSGDNNNNVDSNCNIVEGPPIKKRRGRPPKISRDITGSGVLQNVEKRVSEEQMKKNWTMMSESAQSEVVKLLAEASFQIVGKFNKKEKYQRDVQRLLSSVNDKIKKRLPRILVPKTTKVRYFKYESMASQDRFLEASLSATLDQVAVLKKTIEEEKIDLAKQQKYLRELKNNARLRSSDMISNTKNVERKLLKRAELSQSNELSQESFHDDPESINYIGNYKRQEEGLPNHPTPGRGTPSIATTSISQHNDQRLNGILGKLSGELDMVKESTRGCEHLIKKINDIDHIYTVIADDESQIGE
ncbi:hypothetical protein NADFUDRAFT_50961 [Nadsonia fulvescens var. elongata DSM 6958]|uniref:Uncharacterized protein n=1 Tax=Nadsonia fulvescens var. elongata DSM 6958 TaxID=857566 RepID=A0A1E3PLG3_9ASCO|nr:hypothetical protein NADFUDRAFT_50961 [Nadsonia fulvescens var. elongata DSM 6958]